MGRNTLERIRREFQLRNRAWNYLEWDVTEWEEFDMEARRLAGIQFNKPLPDFDYDEWSKTM